VAWNSRSRIDVGRAGDQEVGVLQGVGEHPAAHHTESDDAQTDRGNRG
jgi:hypothetical protein